MRRGAVRARARFPARGVRRRARRRPAPGAPSRRFRATAAAAPSRPRRPPRPRAVAARRPPVGQPHMAPAGVPLEELHLLGAQPVQRPGRRRRVRLPAGPLPGRLRGTGQLRHRAQLRALPAGQRRRQRTGRARVQVGLRLLGRSDGDRAAYAHLAAEHRPVEEERGVRAGGEVAALAAVGVRGEGPAVRVGAVQHHDPYVRQSLGVGGRQRHRVRLALPGRHRLAEPPREQGQRVAGRVCRVEGRQFGDRRVPDPQRPQQLVDAPHTEPRSEETQRSGRIRTTTPSP